MACVIESIVVTTTISETKPVSSFVDIDLSALEALVAPITEVLTSAMDTLFSTATTTASVSDDLFFLLSTSNHSLLIKFCFVLKSRMLMLLFRPQRLQMCPSPPVRSLL